METLNKGFKSDKFMAACIFCTVYVCTSFTKGSVNILGILTLIFMWTVYSGAKKGKINPSNIKGLGTMVKIEYVLMVIGIVCLTLVSAVFIFVLLSYGGEELMNFITDFTGKYGVTVGGTIEQLVRTGAISLIVSAILFLTVFAAISTFAGFAKIKKFVCSVVDKALGDGEIQYVKSARTWFYIFAASYILGSLLSLGIGSLPGLAHGGEYIVLGMLLKEYQDGKFNAPDADMNGVEYSGEPDATDINWDDPKEVASSVSKLNGDKIE